MFLVRFPRKVRGKEAGKLTSVFHASVLLLIMTFEVAVDSPQTTLTML